MRRASKKMVDKCDLFCSDCCTGVRIEYHPPPAIYSSDVDEYVRKAEKKKIRFELFGDDFVEIKEGDYSDNYLLINRNTWKELKSTEDIVWH